jgi:hypothetical protein
MGLVGAAVIGTGVGLRLAAGGVYDRIDRGYPPFADYQQLQSVRHTGELEQYLALGFLVAGAAIIVVAAIVSLLP